MAGDWIKMRCDLATDPAVIAVAAALGMDEDTVVGKLHKLWSWADKHTADGNAPGVTDSWLDRYLCVAGFAQALQNVGWLHVADDGIVIPNFDRHNGQSAKGRALTSRRVQQFRDQKCNAPSVTPALPEKRREEKSLTEPSSSEDGSVGARQAGAPKTPPAAPSKSSKPKRQSRAAAHDAAVTAFMDANDWPSDEVRELFQKWLDNRRTNAKYATDDAITEAWNLIKDEPDGVQLATLRAAVIGGYQGLHRREPEKPIAAKGNGGIKTPSHVPAIRDDSWADFGDPPK